MNIFVINGPNLDMLGIREVDIYGKGTYEDLKKYVSDICLQHGIECEIFQSNYEGAIIEKIHEAYGKADAIIINAAGYTHTSIAILDAVKAVSVRTVEVHLSDVISREDFRKISYVGLACEKCFSGKGFESYKEAIEYLIC